MRTSGQKRAVLIAGPTASGKSALALKLAEAQSGALINADASQVYAELAILSARPSEAEMAKAPHYLYGHVPAAERYSVARWLAKARATITQVGAEGRLPIFVGGTGLYFRAALEGLADVPPIPPEVRAEAAALWERLRAGGFHERLAALDPAAAESLPLADRYRRLRAYEVARATGKTLADWQTGRHRPLFSADEVERLVLMPEREALYAACDARFDAMIAAGALDEVRALLVQDLAPKLPAMKAVGVSELACVLAGEWSLEEAVEAAKRRTRRFAKRQLTWIRHQMADWHAVGADELAVRLRGAS